jgi:hypothetical protein
LPQRNAGGLSKRVCNKRNRALLGVLSIVRAENRKMKTYGKGSARRQEDARKVRANWDGIKWHKKPRNKKSKV